MPGNRTRSRAQAGDQLQPIIGKRLRELAPIQEEVTSYATRAAEKLRMQESHCRQVCVSLRTWLFNPSEAKYANGFYATYPTQPTTAG
ncbi:hypothetical protein [Pseudomonas sp. SO81]|uniref:DinB/UmuC family translesion DNA polymerase n=1 Tax=Pseudomonas sp. SO81 TaxID=2983246 RepID=UPI00338FFF7C